MKIYNYIQFEVKFKNKYLILNTSTIADLICFHILTKCSRDYAVNYKVYQNWLESRQPFYVDILFHPFNDDDLFVLVHKSKDF